MNLMVKGSCQFFEMLRLPPASALFLSPRFGQFQKRAAIMIVEGFSESTPTPSYYFADHALLKIRVCPLLYKPQGFHPDHKRNP